MKIISFIKIICLAAPLCLSTACMSEQESVFDTSSSARLNKAIEEYTEILRSAPNGWIMEYFPTDEQEGFSYLMKFGKDGSVKMAGKNKYLKNTYKEEVSLYDLIKDGGPVLSFSTYNNIFHLFAYPADPLGTDKTLSGVGLKGDYEFIFIKVDPDLIKLKGKKRDTQIFMRRMEENVSWEDYMVQLDVMDKFLFDSRVKTLMLNFSDRNYEGHNGSTHKFDFILPGNDMISQKTTKPFIVTPTGLRFQKAFVDNINPYTSTASQFDYDKEKQVLVCAENNSITITPPEKADYLNQSTSTYVAEKDKMGGQFSTIFNKMAEELNIKYKGKRDLVSIGFSSKDKAHTFVIKANATEIAHFTIPYSLSADKKNIVIGNLDANNFPDSQMDTNAKNFYKAIPSIKEALALLPGEYRIQTDYPFNLNEVKYVKVSDETNYVIVSRN